MSVVITVLILLACLLLAVVILIQSSKGGGLAAGLTSSNQILGVRKTNDVLEKATWYLAIGLMALCLLSTVFSGTGTTTTTAASSDLNRVIPTSQVNTGLSQSTSAQNTPSPLDGAAPAPQGQPAPEGGN